MATGRTPPRFVPTLTDVVSGGAITRPEDGPATATPAPAPIRPKPLTSGVTVASPASPVTRHEASAASPPVLPEGLEVQITERVLALLEERLGLALHLALRDARPLVREALARALADR